MSVRGVPRLTRDILTEQVVASFKDVLSEQELASRLIAFTGDGATVNGTQRNSGPVSEPFPGTKGNLSFSLQQFKQRRSGCEEKIFTIWCSARPVDLRAKRLEQHPQGGELLRMMVRRLCGRIAGSTSAQGQLRHLHKVFGGGPGGC